MVSGPNSIYTLRPRQNGRHFADDTFKPIFLNENIRISIKISLKFVPKGSINNIPALVQIMAWRLPGDKPLSEPMMVNLSTHICVTRPQWVNYLTVPYVFRHWFNWFLCWLMNELIEHVSGNKCPLQYAPRISYKRLTIWDLIQL